MKVQFTIPLRIKGIHGDTSSMDAEQIAHRTAQVKFHKTIQCIGDGKEDGVNVILMNHDDANHKRTILIPGVCFIYTFAMLVVLLIALCLSTDIKYTTKEQEVLEFLYPLGFDTYTIHKTAILAGGHYVACACVFNLLDCLLLFFVLCLQQQTNKGTNGTKRYKI